MIRCIFLSLAILFCHMACKKGGDDNLENPQPKGKYFITMTIGADTYSYSFDTTVCDITSCSAGGPYGLELRNDSILSNLLSGGVDIKFIQVYLPENCQNPPSPNPCMSVIFNIDNMAVGARTGSVDVYKPGYYSSSGKVIDQSGTRSPDLGLSYTITSVGPVGGVIQGSFKGTVYDLTNSTRELKPLKGSFSVQRSR